MSLTSITSMVAAATSLIIEGGGTPPGTGAAAALTALVTTATSSTLTGKPANSGPEIKSRTKSASIGNSLQARTSQQNQISFFPAQLDTFSYIANDGSTTVQPEHFNALTVPAAQIEQSLLRIARVAPGDLATKLVSYPYGGGTAQVRNIGSSIQPSTIDSAVSGYRPVQLIARSTVRRPVMVSVGGIITLESIVTNFTTPPSTTIELSSTQLTALGFQTTVEDLRGVAFISSAKLQVPSCDVQSYDACAATARVCTRLDSNGSLTCFLAPGTLCGSADSHITAYPKSPTPGTPYLLPGIWYVYVTLVLSCYYW